MGSLNDRIVLFLGAGASKDAGYPVMDEFLDNLKNLYANPSVSSRNTRNHAFEALLAYRQVLRTVRDYARSDFDNIETLYSTAEMYALACPNETISVMGKPLPAKELPDMIAEAIWEVYRYVGDIRQAPKGSGPLTQLLERIESKATGRRANELIRRITVITTNYDLVAERSVYASNISCTYGSSSFRSFLEGLVGREGGLKVLKLHGSINWFADSDGVICDATMTRAQSGDRSSTFLLPKVQLPDYEIERERIPFIVPPTFSKRADQPLLKEIWTEAVQDLCKARFIGFVGYSFPRTDTFVNHLLNVGLQHNSDLRAVVIVNPDASVIDHAQVDVFDSVFAQRRLLGIQDAFNSKVSLDGVVKKMKAVDVL